MSVPPRNLPQQPQVVIPQNQNPVFGNNGNNSPVNELHLIDSLSDINLNAAPGHHFARFLSARNSLELHRNRRRPVQGNYHSVPAFFAPEEYETLQEHEDESSTATASNQYPSPIQSSGMNPDPDSTNAEFYSALPSPATGTMAMPTSSDLKGSLSSPGEGKSIDDPDMTSATSSPPLVSLLSKKLLLESSAASIDPFEERFAAAMKPQLYPFDTTDFPGSEISGIPLVPGSVPVMAFGQSPVESRSLEKMVGIQETTAPSIINADDGLDMSTHSNLMDNVPRAAYLEHPAEEEHDIFGKMVEYNTITSCPSPIHGQYCNLPYNYYSNLVQPKSVPVYYQEDQQQSQIQYSPDEKPPYDTDDELLEPEKPPAPVFLTIRELPIPDAYYVAQTVAPALHPLIAKKCKKDCRTWLWKSSRQREARLAQQEEDERNAGSDMIEKMDSGSSGGRGPTAPSSKNEVADSAYPGLGFDLNRMNLG